MTAHAIEIAEDTLDILNVEHTILFGQLAQIKKDDPRETKYIIQKIAVDQQIPVDVVRRFTNDGRYLIITVYKITDFEC